MNLVNVIAMVIAEKIANVKNNIREIVGKFFDNLLKIKIIYNSKGGENFMPKMIDLSG